MMAKNLERLLGISVPALALIGCPQTSDDDTTPYTDDDSSPLANDDDSATPADDDTSASDDDSGDDDSSPYENHAPYAVISTPEDGATATQNQPVNFDGCASYDPDGDALIYHWDFGDGSTYNGGCAKEHTYSAAPGLKQVRLRVEDPLGAEHEVSLELLLEEEQPTNQSPVAIASGPYTIPANQPWFINFGQSGTGSYDPDGQIVEYFVDWGNGNTNTSFSDSFGGQYFPGTYNLLIRVTDNLGATGEDITTIYAQ